jgi:hypothetical protein
VSLRVAVKPTSSLRLCAGRGEPVHVRRCPGYSCVVAAARIDLAAPWRVLSAHTRAQIPQELYLEALAAGPHPPSSSCPGDGAASSRGAGEAGGDALATAAEALRPAKRARVRLLKGRKGKAARWGGAV